MARGKTKLWPAAGSTFILALFMTPAMEPAAVAQGAPVASIGAPRDPGETETGSRLVKPGKKAEPTKEDLSLAAASKELQSFSKCLVDRHAPEMEEIFTRKPPANGDVDPLWDGDADAMPRCLTAGMALRVSRFLIAGAFARELYIRRFTALPQLASGPLRPALLDPSRPKNAPLLRFADCLISAAPANIDYLVRSPAGTPQESAAFAAINIYFNACLDRGSSIQITRLSLRSVLANVLYRRAMGLTDPAPEAGTN